MAMLDQAESAPVEAPAAAEARPTLEEMLLHFEVERFLYREAALLDGRDYGAWLQLFAEDVRYWMPIRRTKTQKDIAKEFTKPGEMSFIDDNFMMLGLRVERLRTGYAWAEDPPSRVRRFITNVQITGCEGDEIDVYSNFHLYRTRLATEEDSWIGHREDRLRRTDAGLKICKRSIFLEQTVLLSPNLSNFF